MYQGTRWVLLKNNRVKNSHANVPLKGHSHEVYELWIFHQTSPLGHPQNHTLKYYGKQWLISPNICRFTPLTPDWACVVNIAKSKFSSVNDTTKLKLSSVNDTSK